MARPVSTTTTSTSGLDTNIVSDITLDGQKAVGIGFDTASTKSAGVIKIANMFFKLLMTRQGSNPINLAEGTELADLFESNISDRTVIFTVIQNSVNEALEQILVLQERAGAVLEEQIASASVESFAFDDDPGKGTRADFSVNIYNAAGENFVLQIPSIVVS
jgi:hypothetical protein